MSISKPVNNMNTDFLASFKVVKTPELKTSTIFQSLCNKHFYTKIFSKYAVIPKNIFGA